jgi:hypothetical protein
MVKFFTAFDKKAMATGEIEHVDEPATAVSASKDV